MFTNFHNKINSFMGDVKNLVLEYIPWIIGLVIIIFIVKNFIWPILKNLLGIGIVDKKITTDKEITETKLKVNIFEKKRIKYIEDNYKQGEDIIINENNFVIKYAAWDLGEVGIINSLIKKIKFYEKTFVMRVEPNYNKE